MAAVVADHSIRTAYDRQSARAASDRARIGSDPVLRSFVAGGLAWLAAYAFAVSRTGESSLAANLLGDVAYVVPVALAAALTVAAARSTGGRHRIFWRVLAVSNGLWLLGELVWGFYELALGRQTPFPSIADVLYLSSYVLVIPAVLLGFAQRLDMRVARALLDASIMVVAAGFVGFTLLIEPQFGWGLSLATVTGVAYPLLGVAILMVLGLVAFAGNRRVPRSVAVVGLAFAVSAVTDAAYTYAVVLHDAIPGRWVNVGWQLEALLLCLGALVAVRRAEDDATFRPLPREAGLPLVLAGVAATLAIFALDVHDGNVTMGATVVALYAVSALVASLCLTAREKERVVRELRDALVEQERLAVTDGLTGLNNRRFFEEMLRLEVQRAVRTRSYLGLLVIDVDHFKRVNDLHGHPSGDDVLVEIAGRLAEAVRASDLVARYGGEEFVVLLPGADNAALAEVAERCRARIGGEPFRVRSGSAVRAAVSIGGACYPDHAGSSDDLLRRSDSALYIAKELGRNRVHVGLASAVALPA